MFSGERGSIVAYANDNGQVVQINTYDPFGRQKEWNDGIFRYTGQTWLPEIALYNYKARLYDPERIRFMQTDPIGYEDQMNLYAYVGNDPMNSIDPRGEDTIRVQFKDQPIRIPGGNGTIPQFISGGHSGLVIINDQTGLTRYREYGRYSGQGAVPGAVRDSIRLPDLNFKDGL